MKRTLILLAGLTSTAACTGEPDYTPLTFSVDGDRVIAVGEIDGGAMQAFKDVVKAHQGIDTLVLKHIGGSVDDEANIAFSRLIRKMGFTTIVPSDGLIASGGTDLFLAGETRIIEKGACVGVHSWAAGDFTAMDVSRTSSEHDRYVDYYNDIEIDPAFYWFTIEAAPADGMHWMSAGEVARYGMVTTPVASLATAVACDER